MLASSSHVRLVPQWKITDTLAGRDLYRSNHMLSAGLSPMGRLAQLCLAEPQKQLRWFQHLSGQKNDEKSLPINQAEARL